MAGLALLTPVHGSSWSAGNPGGDGDELHDTSLRNEARNACHYRKDNLSPLAGHRFRVGKMDPCQKKRGP